jgi:glycosyltransferase involved in cell wall biosynthesis
MRLPRMVFAYPGEAGIEVAEVLDGDVTAPLRYSFPLATRVPRFAHAHAEAEAVLERILELFRIGVVHVHHFLFWPLSIAEVMKRRRVPYLATLHDFYAVCPSANLLDQSTLKPCCPERSKDPAQAAVCLRALYREIALDPPADPPAFLAEHRKLFGAVLSGAERVLFPSPSAEATVRSVHADRRGRHSVVPHGYDPPPLIGSELSRETAAGPLRVALVGEIAYAAKGAAEYLRAVRACASADIEWHVFGNTERFGFDRSLGEAGGGRVVRHGPYRRAELGQLLVQARIDVGLLLSICPETFSLTLSELLCAGVPVVAARQGALADRLSGKPYGVLVNDATAAAEALRGLVAPSHRLLELQRAARAFRHTPVQSWAETHRELYAKQLKRAPKALRARWSGAELREIDAARVLGVERGASVTTTQPDARYTKSWWFPWAGRLKPYVPEALRAVARRRLAADGLRPRVRWRLPGPGAVLGADLRVVRRYLATTMLESLGTDPHLLLDLPPLWPDSVQAVRFNLWCSHPGAAFAQLYWRHAGDPAFSEEKSITIPLDARSAAWQEYVGRFDALERREAWRGEGQIVALRFDPINLPGLIGLGELAVCASPPQLRPRSD